MMSSSDRQITYKRATYINYLFGFNGRLNRGGFLLQEGISIIFSIASLIMLGISGLELFYSLIAVHYTITVCASVRRLHDCGQSGWLALLYLIGVGYGLIFFLAIKSGDGIPNEHGHNPTGFEVAL